MITDLNRVLEALTGMLDKALAVAQFDLGEDHQYNNGYYQGLVDSYELVLDIYHSKNGY